MADVGAEENSTATSALDQTHGLVSSVLIYVRSDNRGAILCKSPRNRSPASAAACPGNNSYAIRNHRRLVYAIVVPASRSWIVGNPEVENNPQVTSRFALSRAGPVLGFR
jgi:hypothetical protein